MKSILNIPLCSDSLLPSMFDEWVCSFNRGDYSVFEPNLMAIAGEKHPCENGEDKADDEDQEDKEKPHCGHSNKKVILILYFSRKQSSSAFQELSHMKHYVNMSLPLSSDNETETEDKSGISNYTFFKFNTHNFAYFSSHFYCTGDSRCDTDNSMRKAAGGKSKWH